MIKSRSGFTIVELLIVIVVIGILSAITIVAYNGVQQRAAMARVVSSLSSYEKALRQYKVLNDTYPQVDGCLGEASKYPVSNGFAAGVCSQEGITTSNTLNTELKKIMNTLPDASTPVVTISGTPSYRGATYSTSGPNAASLQYIISGNTTCGYGTKDPDPPAILNITVCHKFLD